MIVMDRSTSLANSGACAPLKAAAVNFVEKFAEGRDNLGLITFATSSRVDVHLTQTFQDAGGDHAEQSGVQRRHQLRAGLVAKLPGIGRAGPDGRAQRHRLLHRRPPDGRHRGFPDQEQQPLHHATRAKLGVITPGRHHHHGPVPLGRPRPAAGVGPSAITGRSSGCSFTSGSGSQDRCDLGCFLTRPLTDHWGNSLNATAYRTVTTTGTGLQHHIGENVENFSTNAADHAALRIRRGDPDALNGNRTLAGVMIFSIGLGDVDDVLLKRIANDPSLTPNPVAAGNPGTLRLCGQCHGPRPGVHPRGVGVAPPGPLAASHAPPQALAMANRFQPTHSAKKRLARRKKRVRRLLQAYTASPQPTALTSSTAPPRVGR